MTSINIETVQIDRLNLDSPQGVEKRLAATLRSVAARGNVEWSQMEVERRIEENIFDCTTENRLVTFLVTISSQAGVWNGGGRAYWFEGNVSLEQDSYGVLRVWAAVARITVVSRQRSVATRFTGHGADFALAKAYREVVLRDLGLAAVTGWPTGQRDSLGYAEWASVLEIREETPIPVGAPDLIEIEEPMLEWERELLFGPTAD